MRSANEELETERARGDLAKRDIENISTGDGEENEEATGYIEMNLGLGVLEEKNGTESDSESESGSDSSSDDNNIESIGAMEEKQQASKEQKRHSKRDVLGKLMGQPRREKPEIEVIEKDD